MKQNTMSMAGGVVRNPLVRLAQPVTAALATDEHIAIVGPNGSGKSAGTCFCQGSGVTDS